MLTESELHELIEVQAIMQDLRNRYGPISIHEELAWFWCRYQVLFQKNREAGGSREIRGSAEIM